MNSYTKALMLSAAALGALSVSACATKKDVAEAVAPVNAMAQANADQLSKTQGDLASAQGALTAQGGQLNQIGGQVSTLNGQVTGLSGQLSQTDATAQQALQRATDAGVLAEGKFLYSVVLSDDSVKFPAASTKLSPEATARLDELASKLKTDNKNVYLEIQGYTDATGSPTANEKIGQERAEAVRRYLSTQGVPLSRIATISYGETNPAAPNTTRAGRAQNRRVVIQVLS